MSKQKTILITGANGFTGQHACEYFLLRNYRVIGTGRGESREAILKDGSFLSCNLGNEKEIEEVIAKVQPDFVLHLAGKNSAADSWQQPAEVVHTNVMGTVYLLESIRIHAPKARVVVAGSTLRMPSFSSDPLHPYAVSKAMQILIARTWHQLFGLDVIVANPCNLIGPGPSAGVCAAFAKKIVAMEKSKIMPVLPVHDLTQKRDFLDVRDAVRAYAVLLEKGESGKQYDIGTGKLLSIKLVVETFQELAVTSFTIESNHSESADIPKPDMLLPDGNESIKNLGWAPVFSFWESLSDILHYYRKAEDEE